MAPPKPPRKPDQSAVDNERNQYIPSFIANKPFYVPETATGTDYLEHQRLQKTSSASSATWYDRGTKKPAATKFRKGACQNCGAMTHAAKDCLARPRKLGARWTGKDIQADEVITDVNASDYDAKRDRWNGYDAGTSYQAVVDEYNELEALRKTARQDLDEQGGDRYEEETDMGRQQATSTRNLRLREDTAKYLLNLDPEAAQYDPKSRTIVKNDSNENEDLFVRPSGDAEEFEKAQRYAWETQSRTGSDRIHLQANPTAGAIAMKRDEEAAKAKKAADKKALLEKYGDQTAVQTAPAAVTETDKFTEYDDTGGIKGAPKAQPKSKYPEDVRINNHTAVWGSWWDDFKWGFACCRSTVKGSYCTGEQGKLAFEEERQRKLGLLGMDNTAAPEEAPIDENDDEVPRDVAAETERRKRTIQQMRDGVTEEEMEDYRRKRRNADDPMAGLLGEVH